MHRPVEPGDALKQSIEQGTAIVGIVGMGYVGLPLMLAATAKNYRVIGFDIDAPKVEGLNRGKSPLKHIGDVAIEKVVAAKCFEATADLSRFGEADVVIICVPTPLGPHQEPDLSFVAETTRSIAKCLRRGQLVILESTTYPGTTEEVVRPILEAGGMRSGTDFFLAFSPEREDPGNADFTTHAIPKVVGGDGATALELAASFYRRVVTRVVEVSSTQTAEAVKIVENVFRAVNIALVNELKLVFNRIGIDIFEVVDAAKTKPFGYMPFYPGPGLGGHCIPIDPFYLTWKAREYGIDTRFIELAGQINSTMPDYVVRRTAEMLDRLTGKGLSQARVLIVGVAYKKNVDDTRESPAFAIIDLLEERGAKVDFHDPHVLEIPRTREHAKLAGRRSVEAAAVGSYDVAVIVTDHAAIDWQALVDNAKLVIDTRNATAKVTGRDGKVFSA
jgi:UDP-N-acetyl-D-glucosamine dehydrogenase